MQAVGVGVVNRQRFRNDYPPEWKTLKFQVRSEAGNRCVRCLHPHPEGGPRQSCDGLCRHGYEPSQPPWRILTVHHLDGDKANSRWWNLAALCQKCHLAIQGKVVLEEPWSYEHSDWFKPYAAGWYAYSLLGEDLSRQETMARLDELLALAQPQPRLVNPDRKVGD